MFLFKDKNSSFLQRFNIIFYLRQIVKFVDINRIKRILTPIPSKSYLQIYQLPQAVEISKEKSKESLSKIVKMFAQMDNELTASEYDRKYNDADNNFFTHKFTVIFDMSRTKITNSITREIFKEIAHVIDLFSNIKVVMIFPDLCELENHKSDYIFHEPMREFKEKLLLVVQRKEVIGIEIIETCDEEYQLYYEYIIKGR